MKRGGENGIQDTVSTQGRRDLVPFKKQKGDSCGQSILQKMVNTVRIKEVGRGVMEEMELQS